MFNYLISYEFIIQFSIQKHIHCLYWLFMYFTVKAIFFFFELYFQVMSLKCLS